MFEGALAALTLPPAPAAPLLDVAVPVAAEELDSVDENEDILESLLDESRDVEETVDDGVEVVGVLDVSSVVEATEDDDPCEDKPDGVCDERGVRRVRGRVGVFRGVENADGPEGVLGPVGVGREDGDRAASALDVVDELDVVCEDVEFELVPVLTAAALTSPELLLEPEDVVAEEVEFELLPAELLA